MKRLNVTSESQIVDTSLTIHKRQPSDKVVAIAGNPNVGKSTVFNGLTGLHQHTGNWPGKTVASAQGYCSSKKYDYVLVDIPGTYSLMSHSTEEEIARDFLCFGAHDCVIVVCDATCLERNLNLVLQTLEITSNVLVCVNLMDEANRKGISIDTKQLSSKLGVPVVGITARQQQGLDALTDELDTIIQNPISKPLEVRYPKSIETAISILAPALESQIGDTISCRWLSLRLLECDTSLIHSINAYLGWDILSNELISVALEDANALLLSYQIDTEQLQDMIVSQLIQTAEVIATTTTQESNRGYAPFDRKLDRILTSKWTGYPVLLLLLSMVFWLTIAGANIPSQMLADAFFWGQDRLTELFVYFNAPDWLHGALVLGVYRVSAWVISVMLPPMAIFFPLFTLLEDAGYLPRVAYILDKPFQSCHACGKQALTMCMGLGCNAAGIIGCRIIDSPRERLLAIITNNFVPCNGRFPTLIAIITMFFVGTGGGMINTLQSALLLTGVIVLGVGITFAVTKLLSATILKGVPSSFTLELPPYRRPQLGKVIVRSIFDRTLFVLGRAVVVAAPTGLVIWAMANITIGDATILIHCTQFLDPFAQLIGLDGVILLAFIIGLPANEIVIPVVIMTYLSTGMLTELDSLVDMHTLFVANGWTWITAISTMLFCLIHWPCSTALLTIQKETGGLKWTALSFLIPTGIGITVCFIFTSIARLLI